MRYYFFFLCYFFVSFSQEFDPARNASEPHLAFADGDVPTDKASTVRYEILLSLYRGQQVSKLYNYLLNASIVSACHST